MSIEAFKANFDSGAKANMFDVTLLGPLQAFQFTQDAMLRCRSVSVNGSSMGTNTRNQYNSGYEIPDGTVDQGGTVDLSFLCDSSFVDRALIEAWHQYIFTAEYKGPEGGTMGSAQIPVMKYLDDYTGKMEVFTLNKAAQPTMKMEYFDIYPVSFESLDMSADSDSLLEISVSFQFRHHETTYLPPSEARTPYEPIKEPSKRQQVLSNINSSSTINSGRKVLDTVLGGLNVGGRFNKKLGGYFKKLSALDTAATRVQNLSGGVSRQDLAKRMAAANKLNPFGGI